MADLSLTGAVLLAQATCGLYGSPSSPGGCSLPAPGGGTYSIQQLQGGQLWVQPPPLNFDNNEPSSDADNQ